MRQVLTTHHLDEAEALGDRVVVISRGHVQEQGTPLELNRRRGACVRACVRYSSGLGA